MKTAFAEESLPITRVQLFNNGMVSVERSGSVEPDTMVKLKVPSSTFEDTLRTISWAGPVESVSRLKMDTAYRSPASLELAEGSVDYRSIISAHVGVEARLLLDSGKEVFGLIAGVSTAGEKSEVCIVQPDSVTRTPLASVRSLSFTNPRVQEELQQTLMRRLVANSSGIREIEVFTKGGGTISLTYNLTGIAWSTGYHIDIEGGMHVRCYACVDNYTPEDWTNVELVLIVGMLSGRGGAGGNAEGGAGGDSGGSEAIGSGMPLMVKLMSGKTYSIKARSDCRVDVLRDYIATREGVQGANMRLIFAGRQMESSKTLRDYDTQKECTIHAIHKKGGIDTADDLQLSCSKEDMVDRESLSLYPIPKPVSIKKGHSSLFPYCDVDLDGELVAIFDAAKDPEHLLQGLRLRNTSGKTLECGSILVQKAGTYFGESEVPTLRPLDDCFLTFAVLLATKVSKKDVNEPSKYTHVEIEDANVTLRGTKHSKTTYTVLNKTATKQVVFLLHSCDAHRDFEGVVGGASVDVVDVMGLRQRLRFNVEAGAEISFSVLEKWPHEVSTGLSEELLATVGVEKLAAALGLPENVQGVLATGKAQAQATRRARIAHSAVKEEKREATINQETVQNLLKSMQGESQRLKYEEQLDTIYEQVKDFNEREKASQLKVEGELRKLRGVIAQLSYSETIPTERRYSAYDDSALWG